LTQSHAITTPSAIAELLRQRHALGERRFSGDTDASAILADLDNAVWRARLTDNQALTIALVHGLDMSQTDVGYALDVAPHTVNGTLQSAYVRIAKVYAH
jgi:hypothetical protein